MGPGGIATIIAAASLFVIAVAISYSVIRLGKLIDEACTNLAGLHQVTNKNQRLRARQKFTDYADDFLHLARSR